MTEERAQLLAAIQQKVEAFFAAHPVPAHGIEHARAVVAYTKQIVQAENADPFMCEAAAWLHDIGRVPEHLGENPDNKSHHELSYDLLKVWFREDTMFDALSKEEKIELLYAVRYHWNDCADDYKSAIILRDADKLDIFGERGVERMHKFFKTDRALDNNLRYQYQFIAWLRTEKAKDIFAADELHAPVEKLMIDRLKAAIQPITLDD